MVTLEELAFKYSTDKAVNYGGVSRHGYTLTYDPILSPFRDDKIRLLEIGVCMEHTGGGHSIRMWYDYFPNASIFAFDIVDMSSLQNDRVKFFKGDQSIRDDFDSMYKNFDSKEFDFIIEDGSHKHNHQMISLAGLFKYVKSGGIYFLEDISIPEHHVCCIRNDETYHVLKKFMDTGKIESDYILSDERDYLETHIKSIEIKPDIQDAYAVAIITKK
jgi:uncharacterized protein (UPF0248 family)